MPTPLHPPGRVPPGVKLRGEGKGGGGSETGLEWMGTWNEWHHGGSSEVPICVSARIGSRVHDASGRYSANGRASAPEHRVMLMWLCASSID